VRGSSCLLPELGAQSFERAREPRLDCAATAAERGRGLLLRQIEEVAARDRLAVMLFETVHGGEQLLASLRAEECRLGGRGRVPRDDVPGRAQRDRLAAAAGATAIARLVRDDAQQPRLERRTGTEAPERAMRLHEAVLRSLLRVGGIAGDKPCGAKGDALVRAHELLVSGRVSPLGAGDELRFGHRGRPTTAAYTPGLRVWFHRRMELRGSVCLVTGATGGIGRATVAGLAGEGGDVVASGLEDVDLSLPGAAARLAAEAGPVDVLVNCAGVGQYGPVHEADAAKLFAVNVRRRSN